MFLEVIIMVKQVLHTETRTIPKKTIKKGNTNGLTAHQKLFPTPKTRLPSRQDISGAHFSRKYIASLFKQIFKNCSTLFTENETDSSETSDMQTSKL